MAAAIALAGSEGFAQIQLTVQAPFHRVVEELHPESRWTEIKHGVGWTFRNTLTVRRPFQTGKKRVIVDDRNTFRLGDLIDLDNVSEEAHGLIVVVDSVYGPNHHYVTLSKSDRKGFADKRLSALPPHLAGERERHLKRVDAWAREVLALPQEYRTEPIAVPRGGARLAFAIGFEDLLEEAGVRRLDDPVDNDGKRTPPVRAVVLVESEGGARQLYAEVLEPARATPNKRRYREKSIDLSAFSGQTIRIVFRFESATKPNKVRDRTSRLASAFSLPLWGDPVIYATQAAPGGPKSVLMISLDTLRADHLGCYGYPRDTSPNIDRFAEEAVLFENCLSTSSWTTPAHATVFTGLPLSIHRAGAREGWRLGSSATTLAELARRSGRLTAAFTHGHAVAGNLGFNQGFDQYSNGPESGQTPDSPAGSAAGQIFGQGRRWLERFGHLPFFLFLHTYEIHAPYLPPTAFADRYTDKPAGDGVPRAKMGAEDRERIVGLYDAEIAYTDHVLGDFFAFLRDSGLLETTAVILLSDHGEEFWEHGGVEHSYTLFQEQLHVPLIVRLAGAQPPAGRFAQRVSLADVFATTLSILDLRYVSPSYSIDLLPFIRNGNMPYPRVLFQTELYKIKEDYYMISGISEGYKLIAKTHYDRQVSPLYATQSQGSPADFAVDEMAFLRFLERRQDQLAEPLAEAERRVLVEAASEELYDLHADPGETHSIHDDAPDALRGLRGALLEALRAWAEEAEQSEMIRESASPLTEQEEEALRALGYVE